MKTERLTIKYDDTSIKTYVLKDDKNNQKAREKLGQLEDDDEELGIDSHILFQALKQKEVYVIKEHPVTKEKKIVKAKFQLELFYNAFNKFHCSLWFEELGMDVPAKFYGTDWALTREELEK